MLLDGRIAIVTGASRGIGAASAKLLARHGAAVGVNYFQSETAARDVVGEITAGGGRAVPLRADARDESQVRAMAAEAERSLGPVDTLVVNAAISFPTVPFLEFRWEDFEAKIVGEMKAAFFCCKAFAPGMAARRRGCVIAISSGFSRYPGFGFNAHSTAKSALDAFGKAQGSPTMADLRDAGSIEQDADVILLLYRPNYYDKKSDPYLCEIGIAKKRNGPTGCINTGFNPECVKFFNR